MLQTPLVEICERIQLAKHPKKVFSLAIVICDRHLKPKQDYGSDEEIYVPFTDKQKTDRDMFTFQLD